MPFPTFCVLKYFRILWFVSVFCCVQVVRAQQANPITLPSALVEVAHVEGDRYTGFRKSCLIVFSDGRYHREHDVQDWPGGRGQPRWERSTVFEGGLSVDETKLLLAEIDEPGFSSISGVLGKTPNVMSAIGVWMGGPEIIPTQNVDILTASIAHRGSAQVFQVGPGAERQVPSLSKFLEWFKKMEKRPATRFSPWQANECASLSVEDPDRSAQRPASRGIQFPVLRTAKADLVPATSHVGNVALEFIINPDGGVGAISLKATTNSDFEKLAVDAAKRWKFYPGRLLNVPIAFPMQAEITFSDKSTVKLSRVRQMRPALGP